MRPVLAIVLAALAPRIARASDLSEEVKTLTAQNFNCRFDDAPEQPPLADGAMRGWMVFTKQRSGSRWFVDTVILRSGPHFERHYAKPIGLGGTSFSQLEAAPDHEGCFGDKPSKRCSCALRQAFAKQANERSNTFQSTQGFKWILREDMTPVIASTCELRLQWVIMLRRNILRRHISNSAAKLDKRSHVKDKEDAKDLRENFKPTLNPEKIYREIKEESDGYVKLIEDFKQLCQGPATGDLDVASRVHYYEDLVDSNPASPGEWGKVLYQLGGWNTSNVTRIRELAGGWRVDTRTTVVHGTHPVADLIANYGAVEEALRGTEFEWMLH